MKRHFLLTVILTAALLCTGCSKKNKLVGNWQTVELIKDGVHQTILLSNINFEPVEQFYKISGKAGLNLYYAFVYTDKDLFQAFGMANTGFPGDYEAMEYEDMFFDAVMNSDSYKIENNRLHIYNHDSNLEIVLEKQLEEKTPKTSE